VGEDEVVLEADGALLVVSGADELAFALGVGEDVVSDEVVTAVVDVESAGFGVDDDVVFDDPAGRAFVEVDAPAAVAAGADVADAVVVHVAAGLFAEGVDSAHVGELFLADLGDVVVGDVVVVGGGIGKAPTPADGDAGEILTTCLMPKGRWLATGGADRTVRLWRLDSLQPDQAVEVRGGADSELLSLAASPNGRWLVSGCKDDLGRCWDLDGSVLPLKAVTISTGHHRLASQPSKWIGYPISPQTSPDASYLVQAVREKVLVWNLKSSEPNDSPAILDIPVDTPQSIKKSIIPEFRSSLDGGVLAAFGSDQRVRVWKMMGGKPLGLPSILDAQDLAVKHIFVSPDGSRLVAMSEDSKFCVWNPRTAVTGTAPVVVNLPFRARDAGQPQMWGNRLVIPAGEAGLLAWDLTGIGPYRAKGLIPEGVFSLALSSDGTKLATIRKDKRLHVYAVDDHLQLRDTFRSDDPILGYAFLLFSSNGQMLIELENGKAGVVWDLTINQKTECPGLSGSFAAGFSPDGHWIFSVRDQKGNGSLWNLTNPKNLRPLNLGGHLDAITSVAFNPAGSVMATGSSDGTVRLWDLTSAAPNENSLVLKSPIGAVNGIQFNADGSRLVATGVFRDAVIWDVRAADLIATAPLTVGRNLTWLEWKGAFAGKPYVKTLNLPVDVSVVKGMIDEADVRRPALGADTNSASFKAYSAVYGKAAELAKEAEDPDACDTVFRRGYAFGLEAVVKPAWDEELRHASDEGWVYQTNGAVLANKGDLKGAIVSFERYISWSEIHEYKAISALARCKGWVAQLKEGRNPFKDRRNVLGVWHW